MRASEEERILEKKATGRPDCRNVPAIVRSDASVSTCTRDLAKSSFTLRNASDASGDKGKEVQSINGRILFE